MNKIINTTPQDKHVAAPAWFKRLLEEAGQLDTRINGLVFFLKNEPGPSAERLPDIEHTDLLLQLAAMKSYQHVLLRRINRLGAAFSPEA